MTGFADTGFAGPGFAGKVLFVDDERAVRLAAEQTLDLAGCAVVGCAAAEPALALLDRDFPGVLISDVRMPGLDGLGLLKRVRAIDPDLPVILVTGHGDVAMAVQAMRDGAYDFIEKPWPADRLVESVRRALEKRRLVLENRALKAAMAAGSAAGSESPLIGRTPPMERLRKIVATVADTAADVLLIGETGAGKEMVARALHDQSGRRDRRFVALNCGAMPDSLVEAELFGHEAGAFTGAARRRIGRIEHAHRGTLFLDEIESMPLSLQVKLLRVLQDRLIEPLGSNQQVAVDIRVVATTKLDLRQAAAAGRFREDLYYRLNVVSITIPPLRDRREDIPLLFRHFVAWAAARYGREAPAPGPDTLRRLMAHDWPGNVRELRNAADRFVLGLEGDPWGDPWDAPENPPPAAAGRTLAEQMDGFERSILAQELARHRGDVRSVIEALGLPRKTFYDKMRRHGLSRNDFR